MASASNDGSGREVQLFDLSLEQLSSLKTQTEEEMQELSKQMETLHGAKNRFLNARMTLDDMSTSPNDTTILVPLTSSLYVPGKVADVGKVIVELGTGYYCEKNIPSAKDLIDRKLVGKSLESVENVGTNKRKALENIIQVMQYKIRMAQSAREGSNTAIAAK